MTVNWWTHELDRLARQDQPITCPTCRRDLEPADFYPLNSTRSRRQRSASCRDCTRRQVTERRRQAGDTARQHHADYMRRWRRGGT